MGRTAHLCNEEGSASPLGKHRLGVSALHIISLARMSRIASLPPGLNGLALAWESVGVVVGALVLGLAAGLVWRARGERSRRVEPPAARLHERELTSLRRIASELARAGDVEAVV